MCSLILNRTIHHFGKGQSEQGCSSPPQHQFTFRSPSPSSASKSSEAPKEKVNEGVPRDSIVRLGREEDRGWGLPQQHQDQQQQEHQFTLEVAVLDNNPHPFSPSLEEHEPSGDCGADILVRLASSSPVAASSSPSEPAVAGTEKEEQPSQAEPFDMVKVRSPIGPSRSTKREGEAEEAEEAAASSSSTYSSSSSSYYSYPQQYRQLRRRGLTASCTHTTMVRMYTLDHKCDLCHQFGQFGWLYRCTQDREELIRQQLYVGSNGATLDEIGDNLAQLVKPRPRGPEKRTTDEYGSFFNETTPEQMSTYRPDQIATILRQRENVKTAIEVDMATLRHERDQDEEDKMQQSLYALQGREGPGPQGPRQQPPSSPVSAAGPAPFTPAKRQQERAQSQAEAEIEAAKARAAQWDELERTRPWVPRPVDECQYKACPRCRPSCADRAHTSLDGVVKGDVPATAATGFGFHVFGRRPVCDANVVAGNARPECFERDAVALEDDAEYVTVSTSTSSTPSTDSADRDPDVVAFASLTVSPEQVNDRPRLGAPASSPSLSAASAAAAAGQDHGYGHLPRSPASANLPYLTNIAHAAAVSKAKKREKENAHEKGKGKGKETEMMEGVPLKTEMEEKKEAAKREFGKGPLEVEDGVAVSEESIELHVADVVTQV